MRSLKIEGVEQVERKVEPKHIHAGSLIRELLGIKEIEESFMFLDEKMHEQDNGDHDLRAHYKKARIHLMLLQDILETYPALECPQKWIDELNGDWYLYLLRCNDGSHYVGISKNPADRLNKHNRGKGSKFITGSRLPAVLLATRGPYTESSAKKWEHSVKRRPLDKKMKFFRIDPEAEFRACLAIKDQRIREETRKRLDAEDWSKR